MSIKQFLKTKQETPTITIDGDETATKYDKANSLIFGNNSFRKHQFEIIDCIMQNKNDVFVIMSTGAGKTLCYALSAILTQGVTVVISPLLSLIEDQVSALLQRNIPTAFMTSTCTESMIKGIFEDLDRGKLGLEPFLKLLYVTPERIVKSTRIRQVFQELYQNEMLARFVIDEAHCVSQWGHDFRTDYGALKILKEEFPEVKVIALTATARKKVADDCKKILQIPNCIQFNTGFDRPNLYFEVLPKPVGQEAAFATVYNYIQTVFPNQTGIIYCMTKNDCEVVADYLRERKIKADYYHAGQSTQERSLIQSSWLKGEIKVICATIAYGMGINMPSVRFVLHLSIAKSIEGYYQEAGRAGRDGQYSECILFYHENDVRKLTQILRMGNRFGKSRGHRISERDQQMVEEMLHYCQEEIYCRRKVFAEIFQSQSQSSSTVRLLNPSSSSASSSASLNGTSRCDKKCDNCTFHSSGNGSKQRRNFTPMEYLLNNNNNAKNTTIRRNNTTTTTTSNTNLTLQQKSIKNTTINHDVEYDDLEFDQDDNNDGENEEDGEDGWIDSNQRKKLPITTKKAQGITSNTNSGISKFQSAKFIKAKDYTSKPSSTRHDTLYGKITMVDNSSRSNHHEENHDVQQITSDDVPSARFITARQMKLGTTGGSNGNGSGSSVLGRIKYASAHNNMKPSIELGQGQGQDENENKLNVRSKFTSAINILASDASSNSNHNTNKLNVLSTITNVYDDNDFYDLTNEDTSSLPPTKQRRFS